MNKTALIPVVGTAGSAWRAIGVLFFVNLYLCAFAGQTLPSPGTDGASQHLRTLPYPFDFDIPCGAGKPELEFSCPVPKFPHNLMVYRVVHPKIDEGAVSSLGKRFGFASVARNDNSGGPNSYRWLKESGHLMSVNPENGTFTYRREATPDPEKSSREVYPPVEKCRQVSDEFLKSRDLLPSDASLSTVTAANVRSMGGICCAYQRTLDGYRTHGAGARMHVYIDANGEVRRVLRAWQDLRSYRIYPLRTVTQALENLRKGDGLTEGSAGKIEKVELLYYTSPVRQNYVQPFYMFRCIGPNGNFDAMTPAVDGKYLMPIETRGILNAEDSATSVSKSGG